MFVGWFVRSLVRIQPPTAMAGGRLAELSARLSELASCERFFPAVFVNTAMKRHSEYRLVPNDQER